MQRSVAVVLVCTLGLGCGPTMTRVGIASGIGITAIGVALATGQFKGGETDPKDVAWLPLSVGLVILIPSVIMLLSEKPEPAAKPAQAPAPDPAAPQRDQTRAHAWELTKQAAAAARASDCPTAVRLDAEVKALDVDFHETVFLRDAAIARCLQPATSPRAAD